MPATQQTRTGSSTRRLARFGRVDGLINNAAVIPPLAPIAEVATEVLEQSLEGNFLSAFHLSRAVIPAMLQQGHGSIVMVSSAVVRHPKVGFGVYNVGKHAMVGMARSLALELGPAGIRVNTLAPGKIAGERLDDFFEERAPTLGVTVDELRDRYTANIALRRLPSTRRVRRRGRVPVVRPVARGHWPHPRRERRRVL